MIADFFKTDLTLSLSPPFLIFNPMPERMVSDVLTKPDAALEMTLRPSLFSDFTGQAKVKERLEISVSAAKQRGEALDHILLSGPPGLGKTTLANILSGSIIIVLLSLLLASPLTALVAAIYYVIYMQ
ncbi:MAG: ATP-binding protein, partial [Verrucomicrobiota bacterium]